MFPLESAVIRREDIVRGNSPSKKRADVEKGEDIHVDSESHPVAHKQLFQGRLCEDEEGQRRGKISGRERKKKTAAARN